MKYLVTVVQAVTVEADSEKGAEGLGLALVDGGVAETITVEVEPLTRETREA